MFYSDSIVWFKTKNGMYFSPDGKQINMAWVLICIVNKH